MSPAHRSDRSFLPSLLPSALALLVAGKAAGQQTYPPQARFSTHDSTVPPVPTGGIAGLQDYRERWTDVKTPGDGRAYSVGSIEVHNTNGTLFSGANIERAATLPFFTLTVGGSVSARQIVALQQSDASGPAIGWQRYYYGTNPSDPTGATLRSTNARAISVWPAVSVSDMRIAICGETYDEVLPRSNAPNPGWPGAGFSGSSGFIAVFDGNGELLWSHHFFGVGNDLDCAITDVSIRVGENSQGLATDYVTFCGMSNYGNPAMNATLTTVNPFATPTPSTCPNAASGDTDNGAGQWDGIVGRVSNLHSAVGTPATVDFLSVLGGAQQEALFGIADIDAERFAVVGCSGYGTSGTGTNTLPITYVKDATGCPPVSGPPTSTGQPRVGVCAVFSMESGPLVLQSCETIGSRDPNTSTVFRDILMQRYWTQGEPALIMVGSTNDPSAFTLSSGGSASSLLKLGPQPAYGGGPSDGIILVGAVIPGIPFLEWSYGSYRGGPGFEHLTGVQGWSEYYDQFSVVGVALGAASEDFDVASYYRPKKQEQIDPYSGQTIFVTPPLAALTSTLIGGDQNDRPAQMGPDHVGFFDAPTSGSSGGGIAVDATARVSVVGVTNTNPSAGGSTWPISSAMSNPPGPQGRDSTGSVGDAVRASIDLLPAGVGRTDGTGTIPTNGPPGGYPLAGYYGGTTPECALTPFGHQIDLYNPQTAPSAPRILLDWAGEAPAPGANFSLIVSRHPQQTLSPLSLLALQVGFPGLPQGSAGAFEPAVVLPSGWFVWVPDNPVTVQASNNLDWEVVEFPLTLPSPPAGPLNGTITLQVVCLLLQPVDGGVIYTAPQVGQPGSAVANCGQGSQSTFVASPGLWLSY